MSSPRKHVKYHASPRMKADIIRQISRRYSESRQLEFERNRQASHVSNSTELFGDELLPMNVEEDDEAWLLSPLSGVEEFVRREWHRMRDEINGNNNNYEFGMGLRNDDDQYELEDLDVQELAELTRMVELAAHESQSLVSNDVFVLCMFVFVHLNCRLWFFFCCLLLLLHNSLPHVRDI